MSKKVLIFGMDGNIFDNYSNRLHNKFQIFDNYKFADTIQDEVKQPSLVL